MNKKMSKVLAMALAASMMLAACGESAAPSTPSTPETPSTPSTPAAPTTPAEPTGREVDEIEDLVLAKLATSELVTFNILHTQSASDFEGLTPVWSSGLSTNRAGQLQPELASEWGTTDGGKTWTMTIRDGLKWSDVNGEAVADLTAEDWMTGLEWVLNYHKNQSNNTSMPSEMIVGAADYYNYTKELSAEEGYALTAGEGSKFAEMVGIEVDGNKVIYHCVSEKPYFDSLLDYGGMAPLDQALVDSLGVEGVQAMDNSAMWYCGPYIMTEYTNGNSKVYTQNPHYWNADAKRFESITHRMVDSWDTAYQLFVNGEVDYVSLTESMVKTISEDPNHEMHEYLANDWPKAYSYQMHLNYNKNNEDGTPDTNWNMAAANENFRQSIRWGLNLTEYWRRTNTVDPMTCENMCFMGRNLCWTSDGKDYTETLKEKLGLQTNGETPVRYDAAKAAEYKAAAIEELTALGVTFPVEFDYYISGSSQTALDTAVVLKNIFSELGEDYVTLNICTYVSSLTKEVRDPQIQSFVINGWGADYNDPQNFLGQITYGDPNAYYTQYYNNANELVKDETNAALIETFEEFTEMVKAADQITDDMDKRYTAYMDAEVYALNHALVIPCSYSEGWCLTNYDVFDWNSTIKCVDWSTNANHFTGEEIKASKAEIQK